MEEIELLFVVLSSLNLEKYEEWKDDPDMISDVMRFLDNVLN
jgi:ribonucleoside-diphosphate reductase alpha chain